jgi:hypothetical protein
MEDNEQPTPERCPICGEALPPNGIHDHPFDPASEDVFESQPPTDEAFPAIVLLLLLLIVVWIVVAHG